MGRVRSGLEQEMLGFLPGAALCDRNFPWRQPPCPETQGRNCAHNARPCRRRRSPLPVEALFVAFAAGRGQHGSGLRLLRVPAVVITVRGPYSMGTRGVLHPHRTGSARAFHRIFKRPLVLLLPEAVRARLWKYCGPFPLLPLRRLIWVSLLIFLGAATHVVWDAFTHEDGWAVRDFPERNSVMMSVAGQHLHWVGLFQYGAASGPRAAGLVVVAMVSPDARRLCAARFPILATSPATDCRRHPCFRDCGGNCLRAGVRLQPPRVLQRQGVPGG